LPLGNPIFFRGAIESNCVWENLPTLQIQVRPAFAAAGLDALAAGE